MTFKVFIQGIKDRLPSGKRFISVIRSFRLFVKNRNIPFYKYQFMLNVKSYFYLVRYMPMVYTQTQSIPAFLYHITEKTNAEGVFENGIFNRRTSVVFLAASKEYIEYFSSLKDDPVIIKIDISKMYSEGYPFFTNDSSVGCWIKNEPAEAGSVYLTYEVPAEFLVSVVKLSEI